MDWTLYKATGFHTKGQEKRLLVLHGARNLRKKIIYYFVDTEI